MDISRTLVSIILPTYNRADTIERSVKSILSQTYTNFEVIVVDDASMDNTESVISGIKDDRIKYLRHKSNKGGAAARNTGIKAAKGDYIAFQDSDDEWLPQKLYKQMEVFEACDSKLGVVYTSCIKFNGNIVESFPDINIINAGSNGFIHEKFLRYNLVTTQTALVRSECFKKAGGFDERLPRLQDWELWIRISKYYEFELINEPLVNVYYTSNSITFNDFAYIEAMAVILNKHREDFIKNKAMTFQIGILARYALKKGNLPKNLEYITKNILRNLPAKYNFLFIISLVRGSKAALESYSGMVEKHKEILKRRNSNYHILSQWFCNKSEGKTMELFFEEKGFKRVAIYGAGDLGLKLYKEIGSMGVVVTCFIDNAFKGKLIDNIKVLRLEDLNCNEADMVIVTPTYDFESIRSELGIRGFYSIVSLDEVIKSMC